MDTNDRFKKLLEANPEQLAAVDAALTGSATPRPSFRLYRIADAARLTGISRVTIWRSLREGRLKAVTIREGSRRIPETELLRFVEGRQS